MQFSLKNVIISYPSLFEKAIYNGTETKYQAQFLIDKKDKKQVKMLAEIISKFLANNNPKLPLDKRCIRDGDLMEKDEYKNVYVFKASSNYEPVVVDKDLSYITTADRIYAGCFVNADITFWWQKNTWGERLNATLNAVQFVDDGEPLARSVDPKTCFDDISGGAIAAVVQKEQEHTPIIDDTIPF